MNAPVSDEELARYHDGELSPLEAERVERLLREDPRAEQALGGLEQLGDVLRAWADRRGEEHGDLADSVMARIAEERDQPKARVVPLGGGPARRLRRAAVVVTGALSLAAAAALVFRLVQPTPPANGPARALTARTAAPRAAVDQPLLPAEESEADPAAAIETVDFGAHAGSIFVVDGSQGDVPVVWLLDDDPRVRMQPL
jgi:anti-sigma factor RsiW